MSLLATHDLTLRIGGHVAAHAVSCMAMVVDKLRAAKVAA